MKQNANVPSIEWIINRVLMDNAGLISFLLDVMTGIRVKPTYVSNPASLSPLASSGDTDTVQDLCRPRDLIIRGFV